MSQKGEITISRKKEGKEKEKVFTRHVHRLHAAIAATGYARSVATSTAVPAVYYPALPVDWLHYVYRRLADIAKWRRRGGNDIRVGCASRERCIKLALADHRQLFRHRRPAVVVSFESLSVRRASSSFTSRAAITEREQFVRIERRRRPASTRPFPSSASSRASLRGFCICVSAYGKSLRERNADLHLRE